MKQVTLKVDNKSAIDLSKNLVYHSHSKHIDIRYQFSCSCLEQSLVELKYVKIEVMDIMWPIS